MDANSCDVSRPNSASESLSVEKLKHVFMDSNNKNSVSDGDCVSDNDSGAVECVERIVQ